MSEEYERFLASKRIVSQPTGIAEPPELHPSLFPFQRDIVRWALKRGRAALFEECGLGKSRQAIEWARVVTEHTGKPTLIATPLAVARQFVREGQAIGVEVTHCKEPADLNMRGINVVNYERIERFDSKLFGGFVADESSIIKSHDSKTRNLLIESFRDTPFKLACTATPSPNDHVELGNHAEFLGVMSRTEMLSMFFVHDAGETQTWRLKGHAQKEFWRWVCSWAVSLMNPRDLGYEQEGYDLPALRWHEHLIQSSDEHARSMGMFFCGNAQTLQERRQARRASLGDRVALAAELANADNEQWMLWTDLNDESAQLTKLVRGAIEVKGADSTEHKESTIDRFQRGEVRAIVSKGSIFGWGINLQNCHKTAFVGLSDSFEAMYQSVRRVWRFGQVSPVDAHIITSTAEGAVLENIRRKQRDFNVMTSAMVEHMAEVSKAEVRSSSPKKEEYVARFAASVPSWLRS